MVLYVCDGSNSNVMDMFTGEPARGTYGWITNFTAKPTKAEQVGDHKMCIKAVFEDYPNLITPEQKFTVTVLYEKAKNKAPEWADKTFRLMPNKVTFALGGHVVLNYNAIDPDPEDTNKVSSKFNIDAGSQDNVFFKQALS